MGVRGDREKGEGGLNKIWKKNGGGGKQYRADLHIIRGG